MPPVGLLRMRSDDIRRDGQRLLGLFGGARIGQSEEGIALVLDISARKRSDNALREAKSDFAWRSNPVL